MTTGTSNDDFAKISDLLEAAEKGLHAQSRHEEVSGFLNRARSLLENLRKDVAHWKGQFMLSQIDVVSEMARAEEAEQKLSQAVLPLPFDQQRLVEERDHAWLAFVDPVTHLGNANRLQMDLKKAVESTFESGKISILFVIDIDNFGTINDFSSWTEGDEVLEEFASRLVDNTPPGTLLCRRAEDEFAVVVSLDKGKLGESPLVQARQIADFLLQLLSNPIRLNNQPYPVTVSMGISACPDDADTAREMLENAYSALREAKQRGKNRYVIYSDSVYQSKEERARQALEIRAALESKELLYSFRPVVDVEKGHLGAAVVEPEWDHPSHGRLRQDDFVGLLEECGLIPIFANQVIEAGCELARKMKASISVVLRLPQSVLHLHDFEKTVMECVGRARIKPDSLVLELPGEALNEHQVPLTRLFQEMGRWGLRSSLGIGESTPILLGSLRRCGVAGLHLGPELLESVPAQQARREVVQAYLDTARRLGIRLHVSGVRDSSQAHFLALHNCDWASGDYLSPSLNLDEFVKKRRALWKLK